MSANNDPPTIEQRLNALASAIETEAKARAEFEALAQLRGKAIDARLDSQAMHIELLAHETHALGIKLDRIAEKVDRLAETVDRLAGSMDTLKHIVTDLVQLATSHERRISTLEGQH